MMKDDNKHIEGNEVDSAPTITYSDKQVNIIDNTGKVEAANKLFTELKASGALDRLDKLIEQTRAEKRAQE